eukprot:TRINITY_DN9462_c0_g1_i1.p1 TRINITY_DN9462_c0_g1~~TRINITY_DN9462_c0_g1_i1.p1  ORF type:complete len:1162 (+),score=253.04 TRINITY_DN9462_c0_g1_i1:407-3892(+)
MRYVPIIGISYNLSSAFMDQLALAGVLDVIQLPISLQLLRTKVRTYLHLVRAEMHAFTGEQEELEGKILDKIYENGNIPTNTEGQSASTVSALFQEEIKHILTPTTVSAEVGPLKILVANLSRREASLQAEVKQKMTIIAQKDREIKALNVKLTTFRGDFMRPKFGDQSVTNVVAASKDPLNTIAKNVIHGLQRAGYLASDIRQSFLGALTEAEAMEPKSRGRNIPNTLEQVDEETKSWITSQFTSGGDANAPSSGADDSSSRHVPAPMPPHGALMSSNFNSSNQNLHLIPSTTTGSSGTIAANKRMSVVPNSTVSTQGTTDTNGGHRNSRSSIVIVTDAKASSAANAKQQGKKGSISRSSFLVPAQQASSERRRSSARHATIQEEDEQDQTSTTPSVQRQQNRKSITEAPNAHSSKRKSADWTSTKKSHSAGHSSDENSDENSDNSSNSSNGDDSDDYDDYEEEESSNSRFDVVGGRPKLRRDSEILPIVQVVEASIEKVKIAKELSDLWMAHADPSTVEGLRGYNFNPFQYNELQLVHLSVNMAQQLGVFESFEMNEAQLAIFFNDVRLNYQKNPYHSFIHAFDVVQTCFAIVINTELINKLTPLEKLAMLMAGMCHDLDHPGLNNNFHILCQSDLALIYNDASVLENHHASLMFRLLRCRNGPILGAFSPEERTEFRKIVIQSILGTDMAVHFAHMEKFSNMCKSTTLDQITGDQRRFLIANVVHIADISNPSKNWDLCKVWSDFVLEEFLNQGDKEKENSFPISPFMDRDKVDQVKMSLGFIDFIVRPIFASLRDLLHGVMDEVMSNIDFNRNQWLAIKNAAEAANAAANASAPATSAPSSTAGGASSTSAQSTPSANSNNANGSKLASGNGSKSKQKGEGKQKSHKKGSNTTPPAILPQSQTQAQTSQPPTNGTNSNTGVASLDKKEKKSPRVPPLAPPSPSTPSHAQQHPTTPRTPQQGAATPSLTQNTSTREKETSSRSTLTQGTESSSQRSNPRPNAPSSPSPRPLPPRSPRRMTPTEEYARTMDAQTFNRMKLVSMAIKRSASSSFTAQSIQNASASGLSPSPSPSPSTTFATAASSLITTKQNGAINAQSDAEETTGRSTNVDYPSTSDSSVDGDNPDSQPQSSSQKLKPPVYKLPIIQAGQILTSHQGNH